MSILIDHVMVSSRTSSKPNLLCFYIEDYNKYYGVSDFREINNSDTCNYYCKITDDSGRKAYIFFEKIDKDTVIEWFALFLDKNDKPIKFLTRKQVEDLSKKSYAELVSYANELARDLENISYDVQNSAMEIINQVKNSFKDLVDSAEKTIDDLKGQVSKLKKTLEKQANRGFLDRLSNKKVSIDDD